VYYKAAARAASSIRGNASGRSIALARFAILSLLPPAGRPKSHGRSMTRLQVGYSMPRCRQGWWLKQRAGLGLVDSLRPPIRRDPAGNPRRPCDPPRRGEGGLDPGEGSARPCTRQAPRDRGSRSTPTTAVAVSTVTTGWKRRANIFPSCAPSVAPLLAGSRALLLPSRNMIDAHTHTHTHTHAPTHTHNLSHKRDAIAERNVYRRSRELISPASKKDLSLSFSFSLSR